MFTCTVQVLCSSVLCRRFCVHLYSTMTVVFMYSGLNVLIIVSEYSLFLLTCTCFMWYACCCYLRLSAPPPSRRDEGFGVPDTGSFLLYRYCHHHHMLSVPRLHPILCVFTFLRSSSLPIIGTVSYRLFQFLQQCRCVAV